MMVIPNNIAHLTTIGFFIWDAPPYMVPPTKEFFPFRVRNYGYE